MSSTTWQPKMVNLIGMTMSENNIESAVANTQEDFERDQNKPKSDTFKKVRPHGVNSSVPLVDEAVYEEERDPFETKMAQLKRITSSTWVRLVLIIGALFTTLFLIILIRGMGEEQVVFNFGETNSIEVDQSKTGRDNLNKKQAAYLMELQRQEARKKALAGESNAAVIELPRASVAEADLAEETRLASMDMETTNHYEIEKARQQSLEAALAAQQNQGKLNLSTNAARYKEVGNAATGSGYYIDQEKNQIIVPPPAVSESESYARQVAIQKQLDAQPKPNATYNTQYNGEQGGGQQYNNYNNGGSNGGGQGEVAPSDMDQTANQRQPDPDLPIVQQRLYENYEQQLAEQQAYAERLEQQKQQSLERARAIEQNRRQLAAQAFAEQVQRIEQGTKKRSGYSSQQYYQPQSEKPVTKDGGSQNIQQPTPNFNNGFPVMPYGSSQAAPYGGDQGTAANPSLNGSFIPSSYSSSGYGSGYNNGYNNYGYTDPVAGGAYGSANADDDGYSTPKPKPLPKNIIRAGTSWPVVVTKSVNTDEGLQVIAQVIGGPFAGSEVYGIVTPTGRDIGINFTSIVPPNPRMPIVPVNAMALTVASQKQAVSSHKKNHYLQNYTVMALESAIEGYGDAYSNQNETVIDHGNGTVITSKGEVTRKEVQANILSQFADRLNKDVAQLGNRAPTYYVRQGTVLQMRLLSNMDMHQTSAELGSAGRTSL